MEDEETKTKEYPTECKDSAADRTNAEHLHTLSPYAEASKSAQQLSITEPPVQVLEIYVHATIDCLFNWYN